MIDTGYLTRNSNGSSYQISPTEPGPLFFEDSIDQMNIIELIEEGREEINRRKREYMEKSGVQAGG